MRRPVPHILALLTFVGVVAGAEAQVSLTRTDLAALVSRYFGEATPAGGIDARIPAYRIADFDGDGEADLLVPFTDAETAKRGEGCYGLGIVSRYLAAPERQTTFHLYNCLTEYTVETLQAVPIKVGAVMSNVPLRPARPCVRLILKYGDRDFLCWSEGRYLSYASTPRH